MLCDCSPAQAARTAGPAGHLVVYCQAPGCRSAWYRPRHEPAGLARVPAGLPAAGPPVSRPAAGPVPQPRVSRPRRPAFR